MANYSHLWTPTMTVRSKHAQEMEKLAAGAGGISDADMANHLLMPLYALPEKLSDDCLTATTSLTKPSDYRHHPCRRHHHG